MADAPFLSGRKRQIVEIIARTTGINESDITSESRFAEDLRCDSVDRIEIVMALEEAFQITLADHVALSIKTVGDALEAIEGCASC